MVTRDRPVVRPRDGCHSGVKRCGQRGPTSGRRHRRVAIQVAVPSADDHGVAGPHHSHCGSPCRRCRRRWRRLRDAALHVRRPGSSRLPSPLVEVRTASGPWRTLDATVKGYDGHQVVVVDQATFGFAFVDDVDGSPSTTSQPDDARVGWWIVGGGAHQPTRPSRGTHRLTCRRLLVGAGRARSVRSRRTRAWPR